MPRIHRIYICSCGAVLNRDHNAALNILAKGLRQAGITGLMNEYIKVCEANLKHGTDFRELNAHGEGQLQIEPYELDYMGEKLNCIFQGALEIKRIPQE